MGYCYRLYSSAVFDDFPRFGEAEITRTCIEEVVLQQFPFPTPPDMESVKSAEKLLLSLGSLQENPSKNGTKITNLGVAMTTYPLHPRLSKIIVNSLRNGVSESAIALCAACSVSELIQGPHHPKSSVYERRHSLGTTCLGDLELLLGVMREMSKGDVIGVCDMYGLRYKAAVESIKLRRQLSGESLGVLESLKGDEVDLMAQLLISSYSDHIARKVYVNTHKFEVGTDPSGHYYECPLVDARLYIHPSSVLSDVQPPFVLFLNVEETSRLYMKDVCPVNMTFVPHCVPSQCSFSPPKDSPPPRLDSRSGNVMCHRDCTFGVWPLGVVETVFPTGIERNCYFARFFLEGEVCSALRKYRGCLLGNPGMLTTSYSSLQRKAHVLISAFCSEGIDSVSRLGVVWTSRPNYLLEEYLEYIPQSLHGEVKVIWPPSIH